MKKIIFFILPLLLPIIAFSQEDKIEYKDGLIKLVILDNSTKEVLLDKPMGKQVSVTFDKYYKSYYIFLLTEGGYSTFNLDYVQTYKDGRLRYKDEKKSGTTYYIVVDKIESEGVLLLINENIKEMDGGTKGISTFSISQLKK